MAKKKTSTAVARRPSGYYPRSAPIERVRTVYREKKKERKHHRGHGQGSSTKALIGMIIGGLALGFVDKSATAIPTIPMLGKAGTIAAAAHIFGKGKPGMITDIRNAAAVIAGYEMGSTGKIAGDDDANRPMISGGAV